VTQRIMQRNGTQAGPGEVTPHARVS
jgi:hypothetical protein